MSSCLKFGEIELTGEQIALKLVRYQLLEPFLEQVLLDRVLESIPLTEAEAFEFLTKRDAAEKPEDFNAFLADWSQQHGVPLTRLEQEFRKLRVEKLKRSRFEPQVESVFLQHKDHFDQVEFSLLRIAHAGLAQELFFQIRDDHADFGTLAARHSEGREQQSQGWVGPLRLSMLPSAIVRSLKGVSEGQLLPPIRVDAVFWIVRLERFYSARLTETVRSQVRDQLFTNWLRQTVRDYCAKQGQLQIGKIIPTISS